MKHLYVPIRDSVMYFHNTQDIFTQPDHLSYHRHDACELFILLKGSATFYVEHSCYNLTAGDMIILNTDELHRSLSKSNSDYESIGLNIHDTLLKDLSSKETSLVSCFKDRLMGERNYVHLYDLDRSVILSHVHQIASQVKNPSYGSDLLLNAHLIQLMVKVNQMYSEDDLSQNLMPEIVQDTMRYIKENLTQSIQLTDLEHSLNYSGTYISFCFKKHTGLTLREYIIDQRILTAKHFLSGGKTVEESCTLSGFNDYSNFIRTFSKVTGVTPGKFKSKRL